MASIINHDVGSFSTMISYSVQIFLDIYCDVKRLQVELVSRIQNVESVASVMIAPVPGSYTSTDGKRSRKILVTFYTSREPWSAAVDIRNTITEIENDIRNAVRQEKLLAIVEDVM